MASIHVDDALAERVLKLLREDYESRDVLRGREVHVSDIVFPRRTWLNAHHPKPLTDEDLLYFTAGRAHHEIIQKLISSRDMSEVHVKYDGIVGSVDVLEEDGLTPIEVKTTRVATPYVPATIPAHFVLQLGCYTAMLSPLREGEGKLLIFYLGVKDRDRHAWRRMPKLSSYNVGFSNLPKVRDWMSARKKLVEGLTVPPTETCYSRLCAFCKWYHDPCDGWGSDLEYRVITSGGGLGGTP